MAITYEDKLVPRQYGGDLVDIEDTEDLEIAVDAGRQHGKFSVTVGFFDSDGVAATPATATWTVTVRPPGGSVFDEIGESGEGEFDIATSTSLTCLFMGPAEAVKVTGLEETGAGATHVRVTVTGYPHG